MEKTTHLARRDWTNLPLEFLNGTNFDILRNILELLPHFQALRMIWRNNPNILVHYGEIKEKRSDVRRNIAVKKKYQL